MHAKGYSAERSAPDYTFSQIPALRKPRAGSITLDPIVIGECFVDRLCKALKGQTPAKVIRTGYCWYDKTNMADAKIAAVLTTEIDLFLCRVAGMGPNGVVQTGSRC
ncbi:MAG: hypothetical protein ABIV25_07250, partial [Paracoccaceae bacterium]